jgi:hypothetical protein
MAELAVGDDERGCTYNTPKLENASYLAIVTSRTTELFLSLPP